MIKEIRGDNNTNNVEVDCKRMQKVVNVVC
jgi:hypothetical protein